MNKFLQITGMLRPIIDMTNLGDYLLDKLEDYVESTDNKTDDKLVLPAIKALRAALNIPDNDEKTELEVVK